MIKVVSEDVYNLNLYVMTFKSLFPRNAIPADLVRDEAYFVDNKVYNIKGDNFVTDTKLQVLQFIDESTGIIDEVKVQNVYKYVSPFIVDDKLSSTFKGIDYIFVTQMQSTRKGLVNIVYLNYNYPLLSLLDEIIKPVGLKAWDLYGYYKFCQIFAGLGKDDFEEIANNLFSFSFYSTYYSFRITDLPRFNSLRAKYKVLSNQIF